MMGMPGDLLPQTSIIVCTVDRLADLEECLGSLRPFQAAGAEVIVVNNGPLHRAVARLAGRFNARMVTEPRRGVSRARNAGIRAGARSIFAFLDDDSVAEPEWLWRLLDPLHDLQVLAVVGSIKAQTLNDPASQVLDFLHRAHFPEARLTMQLDAGNQPFPMRAALVGNANMAIRREAFERFGDFDHRFGRGTRIGSGEEPDLLLRILLGSAKVVAEPGACILHRHSSEWRAVRRWAFQSGCAHTAILTKHFLEQPALRGPILRYVASRTQRPPAAPSNATAKARPPRLPFLLGSLYGPLAFILSERE